MKKNLFSMVIVFLLFFLCTMSVNALTNESSAVCEYAVGFTLTYKNGKLTYNGKDSTGYKKYVSYVNSQNLITADQKLKCPAVLYWHSAYNGDRTTTFYIYSAENDTAIYETKLTNQKLNNPVETEENKSDLFSCNYGQFVVTTNGIDKLEVTANSANTVISSLYFTASEFGKSCKDKLKYQCTPSMGKNYCAFAIEGSTGNGATLKNTVPLNPNTNLNADVIEETQGKTLLLLIDDLYDSLAKVETNSSNSNKIAFYNKTKKVLGECSKIYADLSIGKDAEEYKKCVEIDSKIVEWSKKGYFGNRIISSNDVTDCTGVLGSLGGWLSRIYNILKLAVPAIIVAMGFKDFIQGMSSGSDDALKKAGTTFIKRLVVGAIFVMLPLLIKMILTFAFGGSFSDICIDL